MKYRKTIQLSFMLWLFMPVLLAYISVSYLLNTIVPPRWEANVVNAKSIDQQVEINQPPQIPSYSWNNEGLVTFWFDDAWLSQYETALPILERHNFKAAVAVPTDHIGYENYMNWYQIKRLQYLGWEITSHSRNHACDLTTLSDQDLISEVVGAGSDLQLKGLRKDIYVPPCGVNNSHATELIEKNYKALRTVDRGLNPLPISNKYQLKIIEVNEKSTFEDVKDKLNEAKNSSSWIILTFHQIEADEGQFAISPQLFENIVTEVDNMNFPVILPTEALSI